MTSRDAGIVKFPSWEQLLQAQNFARETIC
jgi:hypothetical protein